MPTENIWSHIDFSNTLANNKSAFDYLNEQSDGLNVATKGVLKMEVEALDVITDDEFPRPAAIYILYIVSPNLGNYRKKIITVLDKRENARFPVEIYSHIDDKKILDVEEKNFLNKIEEILSGVRVKIAIEELYKISNGIADDKSSD